MPQIKTKNPLKQILKYGQSVWYDGLVSRGDFDRMIREDGLRGATTNPTIFEKALSASDRDGELSRLIHTHREEEVYQTLAVGAVQEVADVFRPVFEGSAGEDGFVSIEVSPLLAYDTEATIREARELWRLVGRPNVMIKVPATREGLPAVRTLIAEGISVNITLIFSVQRHIEVMEAYLAGLEERHKKKEKISNVHSVASFFVSRVDTAVDKALEEKNAPAHFSGRAAIANSKLAYHEFEKFFASPRFQKLRAEGAKVQRPLWASTGTKNPKYSDVVYVESLIGPHTVNTMPPATLDAFRDHGHAAPTLKEGLEEAREVLKGLATVGIDLDAVTRSLEEAGVKLFSDSYQKIIQTIRSRKK